ncbi:hypothetical protein BKN14_04155 [Candidatus Gracilibacteria bacterium HOT-871]|nr:hypothetical protein BKN14_04155 [Candidatus Gracilibacteria bacterium HOT-871]
MSKFGIIVKNKISEAKKKKAFTLVELIIVITILAVLAAIAFLNLNGYTGDARDSVRVSDLKNIQKTMELSLGEGNLLPIPDELKTEKIELQELPGVKWQEGLFGDESIKELRDLSQVPLDPKTKSKYRYLVSENRQNYYLEVELENGSKYILTNYGNALALNSAPNAPKTPGNPGGTTTPPPATPQTQDKDKYHPIGQTINAIVGAQVNPSDGIQNKQDLPSTTVYRWKNGTPGENSGTIEVVYPDSSITEITVTINYSCATGHTKVGSECKANTQACAIVNGNGTQALQPNGTYGTCTASTCNANFHKEGNTCTSNTKTCTAPNGTGTQTWNATENSYGACTVNTCNAGHTKVGNECKVNTQNCTVANGNGTQALQPNGTYGTCTVNTCNANFHKEGNTCTSNTKTCTAPNGTGTQTWNATKNSYGACTVNTCNAGYTKVGNECKANTQACTVANGTGTQALQPNGTYGTCTASTCNANFHKEGNECVSNTRECTISSGAGSRVSSGELQLRGRSIESGTRYLLSGGAISRGSTPQTTKKGIQTWDSKTNSWGTCVEVNSKPIVSGVTGETAVAVGQQINLTINGADSDGDTLTYKSTNLPSGLTISGNRITGTRNTAGEVTFQVVASDGKVDSDPINVKVEFFQAGEMKLTYSGIKNGETIILPYHGNVNITSIDWGDNGVNRCVTKTTLDHQTCKYTNASKGTYTITVRGTARGFSSGTSYHGFPSKIVGITDWNKMRITDLSGAFNGATNFNQPLNDFDTSKVTDMSYMFYGAEKFNQPLNNWDTSNVTNMAGMFGWARSFNQNINNWNTSNVTDMTYMFGFAINFNQPINNWNTSKVVDMHAMFHSASKFNQPLNDWNVSNLVNMNDMFSITSFNQPLNNWDTSNVTNMSGVFRDTENFNQPLNNWNTSKVVDMHAMFSNANNFNQNINSWNVSNVTNMSSMFYGAKNFDQPLNNWNTSKVVDMHAMFSNANNFNQNINSWNVSNVTNMNDMFNSTENFNQPLDNWNISKVTDIGGMFRSAKKFNQPLNNWNTSNVTSMESLFYGAEKFNQPLDKWNVSKVIFTSGMFGREFYGYPKNFKQNISNWKFANPIDCHDSGFSNLPRSYMPKCSTN